MVCRGEDKFSVSAKKFGFGIQKAALSDTALRATNALWASQTALRPLVQEGVLQLLGNRPNSRELVQSLPDKSIERGITFRSPHLRRPNEISGKVKRDIPRTPS